jgi:hypothetical protein
LHLVGFADPNPDGWSVYCSGGGGGFVDGRGVIAARADDPFCPPPRRPSLCQSQGIPARIHSDLTGLVAWMMQPLGQPPGSQRSYRTADLMDGGAKRLPQLAVWP